MSSVPPAQELPPAGGYGSRITYRRLLPARGPSGAAIFAGLFAFMGYGMYSLKKGLDERRELQRENMWSRFHLVPFLQAERDRDIYRRTVAMVEKEAEIMKGVPGWVAGQSTYHNPKYAHPQVVPVPLDN
ncbi:GRIM-19 [Ramicandelaber brevisporus]|nr:GRIM-19 [Ramicandelaber brevisporus]